MKTIQIQGVHHITIVGSTRDSAVDFWQGVLGMPFVMEQPNLGNPDENHLYFDPGDGRLLTVFTNETRQDAGRPAPREIGSVDHIAFNVSRATFKEAAARLTERGLDRNPITATIAILASAAAVPQAMTHQSVEGSAALAVGPAGPRAEGSARRPSRFREERESQRSRRSRLRGMRSSGSTSCRPRS